MKDFTPTKETISLHGLGFLQLTLPERKRLHVWHPDLPRRECYNMSAIHNHRFAFKSTVLIGTQINLRYDIEIDDEGTHDLISHNGPRSPLGGRISKPVARCNVHPREIETYEPGQSYVMPALEYHETPNSGIVVTLMEKTYEGSIHATSVIRRPYSFDQTFDRFQLPEARLWDIVTQALSQKGLSNVNA